MMWAFGWVFVVAPTILVDQPAASNTPTNHVTFNHVRRCSGGEGSPLEKKADEADTSVAKKSFHGFHPHLQLLH